MCENIKCPHLPEVAEFHWRSEKDGTTVSLSKSGDGWEIELGDRYEYGYVLHIENPRVAYNLAQAIAKSQGGWED